MDFYSLGQRQALQSFLKEADYADSLADVWGKVAPPKTPVWAPWAGAAAGAMGGSALGKGIGSLAKGSPKLIEGFGPIFGGAGARVGLEATAPLHRALVKNRRAAGIRKVAPKAGMALGATAVAAALAHHFLSRKDETKEARIFGAEEPYGVTQQSVPYEDRKEMMRDYADEKSKESPTGYLKAMGAGGAIGGLSAGAMSGLMAALHGASGKNLLPALLAGGLTGGGLGLVGGALAAHGDKREIARAQALVGHPNVDKALARHIAARAQASQDDDRYDRLLMHADHMHALRSRYE